MKLTKEKIEECAQWVRENGLVDFGGATKVQFCKAMSIGVETLRRWEKEKSDFRDAIKKAKDDFKDNLEFDLVKSLAKSAKGYRYKKSRSEFGDKNGKPYLKRKTTEEVDVAPNVGAAIFLLTNIAPERWQNRQSQALKADVKADVDQKLEYDLSDLPEDLLFKMADVMQDKQYEREKAEKENGPEKK